MLPSAWLLGDALIGQRQPQEPRDADACRTRPRQHEAQVPDPAAEGTGGRVDAGHA